MPDQIGEVGFIIIYEKGLTSVEAVDELKKLYVSFGVSNIVFEYVPCFTLSWER